MKMTIAPPPTAPPPAARQIGLYALAVSAAEPTSAEDGDGGPLPELIAAQQALDAAALAPGDVDLLILASLRPPHPRDGSTVDAATLASRLGVGGASCDYEPPWIGLLTSLQSACAHVAGGCQRVLVVAAGSRQPWTPAPAGGSPPLRDAAAALIVTPDADVVVAGGAADPTAPADAAACPYAAGGRGPDGLAPCDWRSCEQGFVIACERALARAGSDLDAVDRVVFETPFPCYAELCARALGVEPRRTLALPPEYATAGPAMLGFQLFHAARWQRLRPGELVLLCSLGGTAGCSVTVLRWGELALGPTPPQVARVHAGELESEALAGFALERIAARVLAPASAVREPYERLRCFLREYTRLLLEEPPIAAIFDGEGSDGVGPRSPWLEERQQRVVRFLRDSLAAVPATWQVLRRIDSTAAAFCTLGLVHSGVSSYLAHRQLSEDAAVEQITRLALHGVTPPTVEEPSDRRLLEVFGRPPGPAEI